MLYYYELSVNLQSYGVRYKHGNRETDFITYVNAVEQEGAAYAAGLREGEEILLSTCRKLQFSI